MGYYRRNSKSYQHRWNGSAAVERGGAKGGDWIDFGGCEGGERLGRGGVVTGEMIDLESDLVHIAQH